MGKKVNITYLLLLLFMSLNMKSYSQELFTQELKWTPCDSIAIFTFQDKEQMIEWSKEQLPFSTVYSDFFCIRGCHICIVMVAGCSGLPCWNIYVFKREKRLWQLLTASIHARLKAQLDIRVDKEQEKIIFETKSDIIIGELSFNILNDNDD